MRTVEDYDAVIIGASFAGLAAATQLQGSGRALLADRQPPCARPASARGPDRADSRDDRPPIR